MTTFYSRFVNYVNSWVVYLKAKWNTFWKVEEKAAGEEPPTTRDSWVKEHTQPMKAEYIGPHLETDLSDEARRKAEHARIFRDDEGVDDGTTSRDITPLGNRF